MLDATDMHAQTRSLVRKAIDRSAGDSWTAQQLANELALPVASVARVLVDMETRGHVVRVDGEWVSAFFAP